MFHVPQLDMDRHVDVNDVIACFAHLEWLGFVLQELIINMAFSTIFSLNKKFSMEKQQQITLNVVQTVVAGINLGMVDIDHESFIRAKTGWQRVGYHFLFPVVKCGIVWLN